MLGIVQTSLTLLSLTHSFPLIDTIDEERDHVGDDEVNEDYFLYLHCIHSERIESSSCQEGSYDIDELVQGHSTALAPKNFSIPE